ncbi:MAG: SocA family protein [Magnetococcales bacterium]|nr:SocA family protein [Magnetococcales bacterium]
MFDEIKVSQVAAFFLNKAQEGRMPHLKLMKLMYLADREAIHTMGLPITWDCPVSMPHGPVLSRTLDLMDGNVRSSPGGWENWVSAKENHEVSSRTILGPDRLTKLSKAEISVLESVWQQFGGMSRWEIRDWTHDHCPEWEDPHGSSFPISFDSMARCVGFDADAAAKLAERIEEAREIDQLFASL